MIREKTIDRYARQVAIPGFSVNGQESLKGASVAVVGAGGLGSPVLLYLVAAGVGHITIFDDDSVALSNLHRQVLYREPDLGQHKVESASTTLSRLNADCQVAAVAERLTSQTAGRLPENLDLVVDATDNFDARYFISDICSHRSIPHVWGAVFEFEGQASVFTDRFRYRDLYAERPPAELLPPQGTAGVLGATCGVIGSIMVAEVIKVLTGIGTSLEGAMLAVDLRANSFRIHDLVRRGK